MTRQQQRKRQRQRRRRRKQNEYISSNVNHLKSKRRKKKKLSRKEGNYVHQPFKDESKIRKRENLEKIAVSFFKSQINKDENQHKEHYYSKSYFRSTDTAKRRISLIKSASFVENIRQNNQRNSVFIRPARPSSQINIYTLGG